MGQRPKHGPDRQALAHVVRLYTRPARMRDEQWRELREMIDRFREHVPDYMLRPLLLHMARLTKSSNAQAGTFVVLYPEQYHAVAQWLAQNSSRPVKAMTLWALLFTAIDYSTGEILLTRDEIADDVGISSGEVSIIMTELEHVRAIFRHRIRISGMRGPGMVRYTINSTVGTKLPGKARDEAQQRDAPAPVDRIRNLKTLDGGKVG